MKEIPVFMTGASGFKKIDPPSNFSKEFKFLTVINITDNSVCIYPPEVTSPTAGASIICLGVYAAITIPILAEMQNGFNVIFTNPGLTNIDKAKKVRLIFSEENLAYNQSFAPSFTSGGNVLNTAIVADDVGVAKEAKQDAANVLLGSIDGKDFSTEETLALVLGKLGDIETKLNAGIDTKLTGSTVCLSTETKPTGVQGDTLLEYNTVTKETKVYKYISGDWREL